MTKKIFIFYFIFSLLFANNILWQNRNSQTGAEKAYNGFKSEYQKKTNYTSAWQFARAAHFYADNFITENELKKNIFSEAKDAAQQAVNFESSKPEGHYWLGANYGSWAEVNGILESLNYADDIVEEMTRVINIDKTFNEGMPYAIRAKVYYKAPGWPLSIGNQDKAVDDFEQALKYGKNKNRKVYRFFAEYLIQKGNKIKAQAIIKEGLAIPFDKQNNILENKEIKLLKDLQK